MGRGDVGIVGGCGECYLERRRRSGGVDGGGE